VRVGWPLLSWRVAGAWAAPADDWSGSRRFSTGSELLPSPLALVPAGASDAGRETGGTVPVGEGETAGDGRVHSTGIW